MAPIVGSLWDQWPWQRGLHTQSALVYIWMAPWKNRISSTTMKLRIINRKASDVAEYIKLFGSSTRYRHARRINVILWTSTNICIVVHDDLGWKNRTTQYNCRFSAMSLALWVIFVRRKHSPIYASCMTISGGRTKQHIVIGFGELAAVSIRLVY